MKIQTQGAWERAPTRMAGRRVVGEDEEGGGVGDDAAMEGHAVGYGAHAVFSDAEVEVTAALKFGGKGATSFDLGVVGFC